MDGQDKEFLNKLFVLAENYAGVSQGQKDMARQLGSYKNDIDQHRSESANRHSELMQKFSEMERLNREEIRRLVDGMNKVIEDNHDNLNDRLIVIESDKKALTWVLIVIGALITGAWSLIAILFFK